MRTIKFGLAIVAALAVVVAMASSASAIGFLSSITKAKLLSEKVEAQVFVTNAGTVECTEAKIEKGETGTANVEELVQLAEIHYSGCIAFGFVPTTLTNADYLFLPNGVVHLDNLIRIVASGCEVSVPAQTISSVSYSNNGNNLKLEPKGSEIAYSAKGCVSGNGEAVNGTYTGNSEAMISGGKLQIAGPKLGDRYILSSRLFAGIAGHILKVDIVNPFALEAEIKATVVKYAGRGNITNTGTCKVGGKIVGGGTCQFEQEDPVGGNIEVEYK